MLTQERLKELFHYDPDTGTFTWRVRTSNRVRVGGEAGCLMAIGYRAIRVDRKLYLAHRLAWLYVHGIWPDDQMDHINGARCDNRLANLREATGSENQQNHAMHRDNTSGFMGVCWDRREGRWRARIMANGCNKNLGYFARPEDAHTAYLKAKAELHTFNPTVRL